MPVYSSCASRLVCVLTSGVGELPEGHWEAGDVMCLNLDAIHKGM